MYCTLKIEEKCLSLQSFCSISIIQYRLAIFPVLLGTSITHLPILGCIALCLLAALEAVDGGGEHGEVVAALARQQLGVQQAPHLTASQG